MDRSRSALILGIILASAVAACSGNASTSPSAASQAVSPSAGSSASAEGSATQRSEGGQVTVEATWNGPASGASFDVKLDTHSVSLDALDLSNAVLRNDRGETLTAQPWTAAKGGHHREGTLTFGGDATAFFAGSRSVELVLSGIGDVPERTLRWTIGS
jgi:hypothetical protein